VRGVAATDVVQLFELGERDGVAVGGGRAFGGFGCVGRGLEFVGEGDGDVSAGEVEADLEFAGWHVGDGWIDG